MGESMNMNLTTEKLAKFIGGDIKIQGRKVITHFYRGPIKTAVVDEDNTLTVDFEWLAVTKNGTKGPDVWTNVDDPQPWVADLSDYSSQELDGTIILISVSTMLMTVVIPLEKGKLNPTCVAGLQCR